MLLFDSISEKGCAWISYRNWCHSFAVQKSQEQISMPSSPCWGFFPLLVIPELVWSNWVMRTCQSTPGQCNWGKWIKQKTEWNSSFPLPPQLSPKELSVLKAPSTAVKTFQDPLIGKTKKSKHKPDQSDKHIFTQALSKPVSELSPCPHFSSPVVKEPGEINSPRTNTHSKTPPITIPVKVAHKLQNLPQAHTALA